MHASLQAVCILHGALGVRDGYVHFTTESVVHQHWRGWLNGGMFGLNAVSDHKHIPSANIANCSMAVIS